MSDEQLERVETLFEENDPPKKEDDEIEEGVATEEEHGEEDPLAPTGDGDIKPTSIGGP
jgi:hypothetical protein